MSTSSDEVSAAKQRRFERWRRTLPKHTRYLTDLVADRLLPQFESRGFIWHDKATAGFVYLVKPEGNYWPAVQMRFHKRAHPMLLLDVACLPSSCRRWDGRAFVPVDRKDADIVDAPVVFSLRNTRRLAPDFFGYRYASLLPSRHLRKEISTVESLLPRLFVAFERGQLLDSTCWPEIEDFLTLMHDRRQYFEPEALSGLSRKCD